MAEAKVKLCEMSRQRTDHRTPPGGTPRTGDRVTLSYETEHDKLPLWASEYMLVEVIQASGELPRPHPSRCVRAALAAREALRHRRRNRLHRQAYCGDCPDR